MDGGEPEVIQTVLAIGIWVRNGEPPPDQTDSTLAQVSNVDRSNYITNTTTDKKSAS